MALLRELEPRLSCAINWATRLLPPEQRTTIARSFNTVEWNRLDDRTRDALRGLVLSLHDSWDLDGLTALVYSIPKLMLGLPPDAGPTPEIKQAQREFFKVMYRLLYGSDTGPRLPTLAVDRAGSKPPSARGGRGACRYSPPVSALLHQRVMLELMHDEADHGDIRRPRSGGHRLCQRPGPR